jgi:hypothetical protein
MDDAVALNATVSSVTIQSCQEEVGQIYRKIWQKVINNKRVFISANG